MKLTIETKTTKEVDATLPMYIKSTYATHYYAIMSETDIISVSDDSVRKTTLNVAFHGGYEVITRRAFCDKYEQVIANMNNQLDSFMEVVNEMIADELYLIQEGNDNYSSNEEEGQ